MRQYDCTGAPVYPRQSAQRKTVLICTIYPHKMTYYKRLHLCRVCDCFFEKSHLVCYLLIAFRAYSHGGPCISEPMIELKYPFSVRCNTIVSAINSPIRCGVAALLRSDFILLKTPLIMSTYFVYSSQHRLRASISISCCTQCSRGEFTHSLLAMICVQVWIDGFCEHNPFNCGI